MPVCSFFRGSSFYFHVGKFKRKKKDQIEPPPPHAIWTIQKSCGSYPPLGRFKVKFLSCFPSFFFFFYICGFWDFTFVTFFRFYIYDRKYFTFVTLYFFTFVTFFFTYDVEFLHLTFLFFTKVAVVTFVTVFTFKVLTTLFTCRNMIKHAITIA